MVILLWYSEEILAKSDRLYLEVKITVDVVGHKIDIGEARSVPYNSGVERTLEK